MVLDRVTFLSFSYTERFVDTKPDMLYRPTFSTLSLVELNQQREDRRPALTQLCDSMDLEQGLVEGGIVVWQGLGGI